MGDTLLRLLPAKELPRNFRQAFALGGAGLLAACGASANPPSPPPRSYRVAVRDLAVLDSEGRRWMLGPEDGIWYRRENERWLQADPPRRLVCPSCGHHNLGRHSFCVECGQRLNR